MSQKILSKSKLMRGFQCTKNLWLNIHKPNLEPDADIATQNQFDEGNEVGEAARKHIGKGFLINTEYWDYKGSVAATVEAIKRGEKVIFEAAFLYDGFYVRADILKKTANGWKIIEVKKSTSVKDYHIQDAAIQKYIIKSSGLKIDSVSIMHINNKCIYPNLKNLFAIEVITAEVDSMQKEIVSMLINLKRIAAIKSEPKVKIGPHCSDPFECPFTEYCWKHIPKKSVFDLPRMGSKVWGLIHDGYIKITDLNANDFKGNIRRAIQVTKSKKPYINSVGIRQDLKSWIWPLYFFDFETVNPAIPRYEGTNPYSQIPFQYSCHVWSNSKSKKLEHSEYLHQSATDPRRPLIKSMLKSLGKRGSVVSYNKEFEIGVIKKLADFDTKNKKALLALIDRFVDPLPIFREHVYQPEFLGSFSIKAVAPALIGTKVSYENLDIGDGSTAQAFAEQILRGKIKGKDAEMVIKNLLDYCRQDTLAMVALVKWLIKQ